MTLTGWLQGYRSRLARARVPMHGRSRQRQAGRTWSAETLECRTLLSNIDVSLAGGVITMNGDDGDHYFDVYVDGDDLILEGYDGTEFTVNGSTDSFFAIPLASIGSVTSIFMNMGDGEEEIFVDGDGLPAIAGSVIVNLGNGDNYLEVEDLSVVGAALYTGGNGYDELYTNDCNFGYLSFLGGTGGLDDEDYLELEDTSTSGVLMNAQGGSYAYLDVWSDELAVSIGSITFLSGDTVADGYGFDVYIGSYNSLSVGVASIIGGQGGYQYAEVWSYGYYEGSAGTNVGSLIMLANSSVDEYGELDINAYFDGTTTVGFVSYVGNNSDDYVETYAYYGGSVVINGSFIASLLGGDGEDGNYVEFDANPYYYYYGPGSVTVNGIVSIIGGEDYDEVYVYNTALNGGIITSLLGGSDYIDIDSGEGGSSTSINTIASFSLGEGDNEFYLYDSNVSGLLYVLGGTGYDYIDIDEMIVDGSAYLFYGDEVYVYYTEISGYFSNIGGTSDDYFEAYYSYFGGPTYIDLDGGSDFLWSDENYFNGSVIASTGTGSGDVLLVDDTYFAGSVTASMYGEDGTLAIETSYDDYDVPTVFSGSVFMTLGSNGIGYIGDPEDDEVDEVFFDGPVNLVGLGTTPLVVVSEEDVSFSQEPTVSNVDVIFV